MTATTGPERVQGGYAAAEWSALGTYVQLVVADAAVLPAARRLAQGRLAAVDLAYSRFRPDSDLVRANQQAGSWVAVSRLLVDAVEAAVLAAEQTDGLVDPTLGLSLVAVGYDDDLELVRSRPGPGPADLPSTLAALPARRGAWQELRTDPAGALRVPEGVAVDLGATGKAFAADLIAAAIATELGTGCVLSLGGDVAVGRPPGPDAGPDHWQVAICERPDDDPAEVVTLPAGGLATSTTTHRTWTHAGHTVHHLLDPATGHPVQRSWRTASVRARTCLAANTASTATIVLGEDAVPWLTARGLAARLVDQGGRVTGLGGWPGDGAH